jgi:hypothetical protein
MITTQGFESCKAAVRGCSDERPPEHQQLMDLGARVPASDISVAIRILQALIVDQVWLSAEAERSTTRSLVIP